MPEPAFSNRCGGLPRLVRVGEILALVLSGAIGMGAPAMAGQSVAHDTPSVRVVAQSLEPPPVVRQQLTPRQQQLGPPEAPAVRPQDEAELKALTEEVLRSLSAIAGGADRKGAGAGGADNYQQLMQALGSLVEQATARGKSSEEVLALIEEALAEQDDATLEALISQAGGRVGLRRLLQTLVQKAAMKTVADDPYTRMLQAEGEATNVAGAGAVKKSSGAAAKASELEGARTYVVRPGDTLGTIALRRYGNVWMWRKIYEANKDVLKDPDLVPVGVRLRLP